jgi:hypothetical protein
VAYVWSDGTDGVWELKTLDARGHDLPPARIVRQGSQSDEVFVVLGTDAVRVNGVPLDLGIHVLRDRDELRVGSARAFFSAETLAAVEPFPGSGGPTLCPRCKLEIESGKAAVRCPKCRVWHHQCPDDPEKLGCWLYSEKCATDCGQPTALDAGLRWTPEEEL